MLGVNVSTVAIRTSSTKLSTFQETLFVTDASTGSFKTAARSVRGMTSRLQGGWCLPRSRDTHRRPRRQQPGGAPCPPPHQHSCQRSSKNSPYNKIWNVSLYFFLLLVVAVLLVARITRSSTTTTAVIIYYSIFLSCCCALAALYSTSMTIMVDCCWWTTIVFLVYSSAVQGKNVGKGPKGHACCHGRHAPISKTFDYGTAFV